MSSGIRLYSDERTMIKIGSVCPLFFNPLKDKFGKDVDYMQRFYFSDKLLIQILCDSGETPTATLCDKVSGKNAAISLSEHSFNDFITLYYFVLTGLDDSIYTVFIDSIGESEQFAFCSSEILLEETSLIRYSHKDNNSVDNVFWIGNEQQVFEIRYECGFKPSGIELKAEVEQFRNQDQEIIGLYAVPYKTMQLFAGSSTGLPYWFGEHLNKMLCLSKIEISGVEYVRSEDNAVELSPVMEDSQMFFISALLEPRYNEVHGIGGEVQMSSESGSVNIIINNPKEGDTFQYDKSQLAFVNKESGELAALSEPINVTYPQTGFIRAGNVLPKNMTHEDVFKTMLTGSASAVFTGNISTPNDVEYGSPKGILTYTATRNGQGSMKKSYYDNAESNALAFSAEVNGIQTATRILSGNYTQNESYDAAVVYSASADGKLPELTLTNKISVNVRRKWFAGVCDATPTTSAQVRVLSGNGLYAGAGTYKFQVGSWKKIAICIPEGTISNIGVAAYPGNFIEDSGVCSSPVTISVEGADGSAAVNYKMWIISTETMNDSDTFTFKTN